MVIITRECDSMHFSTYFVALNILQYQEMWRKKERAWQRTKLYCQTIEQVNTKQNTVDSLNKHVVNISSYSDVNSFNDSQCSPLKTYVDSNLHPSTQFVVKEITPFEVMKIVKSIKYT